jgi:mono/diheme cytochrome c family protein
MSTRTINVGLAAIMVIAIILNFAASRDFSRPNLEVMPDMAHCPTYQAFEANPIMPDSKTLQPPPPGSIARGLLPLHYERTEQDALRAGEELVNPVALEDEAARSRGAVAYSVFCQHCHGPSGIGDGMVSKRGFPPPASLLAEHAVNMKDGQIFHVITFGQGNMPAHAAQIAREDRWKIISHLRSMQAAAAKQPGEANTE